MLTVARMMMMMMMMMILIIIIVVKKSTFMFIFSLLNYNKEKMLELLSILGLHLTLAAMIVY